jgi:hypothetical protein
MVRCYSANPDCPILRRQLRVRAKSGGWKGTVRQSVGQVPRILEFQWRRTLVTEVANAREYHGKAEAICRVDHLRITE